ncbi:MAG: hypothetical protein ACR2J1_11985 [Methyloceanibacter sp.]|uniref:hypothetical protein n=1 Tax=Methyloceanibacter sp. TaxID=1965321 RepID=UPI003D9BD63E
MRLHFAFAVAFASLGLVWGVTPASAVNAGSTAIPLSEDAAPSDLIDVHGGIAARDGRLSGAGIAIAAPVTAMGSVTVTAGWDPVTAITAVGNIAGTTTARTTSITAAVGSITVAAVASIKAAVASTTAAVAASTANISV